MNWKSFIDIAEEIHRTNSEKGYGEGGYRTSISRAYYGAFNIAKIYVSVYYDGSLVGDNSPEVHGKVRDILYKNGENILATKLKDLRDDRNSSDYNDDITIDPNLVEINIRRAQFIDREIKKLGSILPY